MKERLDLGLFLPARPDNHLAISDPGVAIGCLRPPLQAEVMRHLRAQANVKLFDNLNFHQALIRNGEVWVGETCLDELDVFAWYCEVDRQAGSFDLEVLKTLARKTPVIRDPHRFELALDKYTAHLVLRDAGVDVADFVLFDHRVPGKMADILNEWGGAMLKPRRGGWGKGVTFIDHPGTLRDVIGYMRSTAGTSPDQGFFLERYYENDLDRWASLTMIDGEVVYGYRKLAVKQADMGQGRFKILDAEEKGGGVVLADLVDAHYVQAERAQKALGLGLIGFDMIWVDGRPIVIDENTSPGNYPELYAQVGKDPGQLLAAWLLREARASR